MPENFYLIASWFGILNVALLAGFALLACEVHGAQLECVKLVDEEAWRIVQATLHWNGVALTVAYIVISVCCVQLARSTQEWRVYLGVSLFATTMYWSYARQSDKKLVSFMADVRRNYAEDEDSVPPTVTASLNVD